MAFISSEANVTSKFANFLGPRLDAEGKHAMSEKLEAVKNTPVP